MKKKNKKWIVIGIIILILLGLFYFNSNHSTSSNVSNHAICYNNADCDDALVSTPDLCLNPGTTNSYCHHGCKLLESPR